MPTAVQITVRWGASVLMSKRFSPPKSLNLTGGVGRLEVSTAGLDLVAGRERIRIGRGKRVRALVDDVEIVIDATDDKMPVFALSPIVERRFAWSDFASFALHAGVFAAIFAWRSPLPAAELQPGLLPVMSEELCEEESRDPPPALENGATSEASESAPGKEHTPRPRSKTAGYLRDAVMLPAPAPVVAAPMTVEEAARFGMIGLLRSDATSAASPWASAPDAYAGSWDAGLGFSFEARGIGLSGIGEGAGGLGSGVGSRGMIGELGSPDRASGAFDSIGMIGELPRRHVTRAPTIRTSCGCGVTGRLPAEAVQRIVRQSFGRFRHCYDNVMPKSHTGTEQRVSLAFVIGRDGSVSSSSASGGEPTLAQCMAKTVYALSFPAPEGGVVNVTYPIVFVPEQ